MIKFINKVLEAETAESYAKSDMSIALDRIGINQDNYTISTNRDKITADISGITADQAKKVKSKIADQVSSIDITSINQTKQPDVVYSVSIIGNILSQSVEEEVTEDVPVDEVTPEVAEEVSPSDKITADIESKILDQYPDIETLRVDESASVSGTIIIEGKTDPVTFKGIIDLLKNNYKDYTVIGTNAYSYTTGNFQAGLVPN